MDVWYSLPGFNQPMSCMSHLIGAIVFLVLGIFLLRSSWLNRACFWNILVFVFSVVFLLSMSGVYHMFNPWGKPGRVLIRLDVAAIFLLIAATFTPIHGLLFSGWKRWGVLVPLWTIGVTGIVIRTVFFDSIPFLLGTMIFLAMGWVGGLSGYLLWRDYGPGSLFLVLAGGIMYTIGAVGDALSGPTIIPKVWGSHETFHLFVLAGIGFHWALVTKIAEDKLVPLSPSPDESFQKKKESEPDMAEKDRHPLPSSNT